jgi:hypothetical protein
MSARDEWCLLSMPLYMHLLTLMAIQTLEKPSSSIIAITLPLSMDKVKHNASIVM